MFYIINSDKKCIAICDLSPDSDDLKSRDEFSIESQELHEIGCTYENCEFKAQEKTNAERLSDFLILASTELTHVNSIGLQCYMAGIDFPADWRAYRSDLISLSKTTEYSDTLALPTQPALPSNI